VTKGVHLPSIAGCAVGSGAAGSGVGSLPGTALGARPYPEFLEGEGTPEERLLAFIARKPGFPGVSSGERGCIGVEPTGGVVHTAHWF
jgi:hypothetical protein